MDPEDTALPTRRSHPVLHQQFLSVRAEPELIRFTNALVPFRELDFGEDGQHLSALYHPFSWMVVCLLPATPRSQLKEMVRASGASLRTIEVELALVIRALGWLRALGAFTGEPPGSLADLKRVRQRMHALSSESTLGSFTFQAGDFTARSTGGRQGGQAGASPPADAPAGAGRGRVTRGRPAAAAQVPVVAPAAVAVPVGRLTDAEQNILDLIDGISISDLIREDQELPCFDLLLSALMLGQPDGTDLHELLANVRIFLPQMRRFLSVDSNEPVATLSSGFPVFLRSCRLPEVYPILQLDRASLTQYIFDGARFHLGGAEESRKVEESRVAEALGAGFSRCAQLCSKAPTAEASILQRVAAIHSPNHPRGPLHLVYPVAELCLRERSNLVQTVLDSPAAKLDPDGGAQRVVEQLAQASLMSHPERTDLVGASMHPLANLRQEAIVKSHDDPAFVTWWEEHRDQDFAEHSLDVLDSALSAGSTILVRFLIARDLTLLHTHAAYGRLHMITHDLQATFAKAQTLTLEGESSSIQELGEWRWNAGAFELFRKRDYLKMDWVSHETGFLGVRKLRDINPIAPVPADQHFRVQSVLEGIQEFMHLTMVQAGYPAVSNKGHTARTFFDLHIERLKWAREMGNQIGTDQVVFMTNAFKEALGLAGQLARAIDACTNPADANYEFFLPFDCAYTRDTALRMETLQPLRLIRRALPTLLPPPPARTLDGVHSGSGSSSNRSTQPGRTQPTAPNKRKRNTNAGPKAQPVVPSTSGQNKAGPKGNRASPTSQGPKSVGKDSDSLAPGSRHFLAKPMADGKLALGGRIYDTRSIAAHYKLGEGDRCWPVLLSSKSGAGRLALCPHASQASHHGLNCGQHTHPPGWDLSMVTSRFSQPQSAGGTSGSSGSKAPPSSKRKRGPTPKSSPSPPSRYPDVNRGSSGGGSS